MLEACKILLFFVITWAVEEFPFLNNFEMEKLFKVELFGILIIVASFLGFLFVLSVSISLHVRKDFHSLLFFTLEALVFMIISFLIYNFIVASRKLNFIL